MPPFARHVFVCGNARPVDHPRGCCDASGEGALHKAFKQAVADRGLQRSVRANKSGCLDQCEHGPTVVVYPEGVWYGPVTADDVAEIVDRHLVHGEPVARLRLADACINTGACDHKPRRPSGA
jgi:(2Fe-2S) ferredoxin